MASTSISEDIKVRFPLSNSIIEGITQLHIGSDKEILTALFELSTFSDQSVFAQNPQTRHRHRNAELRALIESHHISSYKKFLNSFKEIKDGVKNLEVKLSNLHEVCNGMSKSLTASKLNSRNLIDEIAKLEIERNKLVKERDLAVAYQNSFQLKTDDLKILRGTEHIDKLSPEFFALFEKIQKIQSNVSVLMKIGHQTTAVEIMDQMGLFQFRELVLVFVEEVSTSFLAQQISSIRKSENKTEELIPKIRTCKVEHGAIGWWKETALEKIYRWAQSHCRHIENPETVDALSMALSNLQIRPMLLKYVIDEYSNHRRSLVVRSFIDALTGVGSIKGIELIGSVDPVRYIGDMLAWIHQAIPGEKENLLMLLKNCNKNDMDERVQNCLATILDGVCRPLNVRIEQTILFGYACVIVNKIDLLLVFFVETIRQVMPESNLLTTLRDLQTLAHQTFINQLKSQVEAELGEFRPPSSDLTPSSVINGLMSLLKDLVETNVTPEQLQTIIDMIVTPLVSQVNDAANRLGSPDQGVYLMNCIQEIIKFLHTISGTEGLCKSLQVQIDSQVDRLSSDQSSWLVAQLGIGHIYSILHEKMEDPLSTIPGMDPQSLKIFINKLDSLITNPESVLLPQLINIADPPARKVIQRQSFRILVAIYKQVYDSVLDPKNLYPTNLLPLDPTTLETSLCS